jgi:prophage regulatory protein
MEPDRHPARAAHDDRILRLPSVVVCTGLTKSTIYRLIAARRFPSPVRLAGKAVGWRQTDLDRWRDQLTPTAKQ